MQEGQRGVLTLACASRCTDSRAPRDCHSRGPLTGLSTFYFPGNLRPSSRQGWRPGAQGRRGLDPGLCCLLPPSASGRDQQQVCVTVLAGGCPVTAPQSKTRGLRGRGATLSQVSPSLPAGNRPPNLPHTHPQQAATSRGHFTPILTPPATHRTGSLSSCPCLRYAPRAGQGPWPVPLGDLSLPSGDRAQPSPYVTCPGNLADGPLFSPNYFSLAA